MRLAAAATVTVLIGVALVGCSDDKPAVCGSVGDLQASVNDVKAIDITASGAADDLKSSLATIKTNLDDVKSDAETEFAPQIDAVDSSLTTLTASVDAAVAAPSASTLAAVGTAVAPLTTAVQTLISDIQSTC